MTHTRSGHRRAGADRKEPPAERRERPQPDARPSAETSPASRASRATTPTPPGWRYPNAGASRDRSLQRGLEHLLILGSFDDEGHIGWKCGAAPVRVQHRGHDFGGVFERKIAGARAERRPAEVRELPLLGLVQCGEPRAPA